MTLLKTLKCSVEIPCQGCKGRYRACHDHCQKFQEYKEAKDADKEKYLKDKLVNNPTPAKLICGMSTYDYKLKKQKENRR